MEKVMNTEKIALLKAMHTIMLCMNDENAYVRWTYMMPDEATEDDFRFIAQDDEEFEDVVKAFGLIMKDHLHSGLWVDGNLYACR